MTRDEIIRAMGWNPAASCEAGPQSLLRRIESVVALAEAQERDRLEGRFKQLEALMQIREQQPNKPCCLAEREACAKVCDELAWDDAGDSAEGKRQCAAAIRARGQPTQADALNAWAADRLARHGIPMPCPDCGGIGYDASGQLCGCQS